MEPRKTDEALLAEFVRGRSAALGELSRRYEAALLGMARGILGGRRDLARDAVQETWVRVIRFGERFDGRSRFKTWLYRIAINQCRTLLSAALDPANPGTSAEASAKQEEAPDRPDRAAECSERNDALRHALNGLSEEQRMVLPLCYHEGMTHVEAAEILEIPLGTLKSRLSAALKELRALLPSEMRP